MKACDFVMISFRFLRKYGKTLFLCISKFKFFFIRVYTFWGGKLRFLKDEERKEEMEQNARIKFCINIYIKNN